jgi:hypothetical protein
MNKSKFFVKVILGILLVSAPATTALAEVISYYLPSGQIYGATTFNFDITPFDTTLGTLNSVTMSAEVNVSGSAQLWSSDEFAVLYVNFLNTLDAAPEMGWSPTIASFVDSSPLWYYDYDYSEGYVQLDGSDNIMLYNIITTDFGRFEGTAPFQIGLQLSGSAYSNSTPGSYETLAFSYDGNATLMIDYDYTPTPVPEPATMMLLGFGLVGLVGTRITQNCYYRKWK